MSATIFCTFEQQDLADLAMGSIQAVEGVTGIHYVVDHHAHQQQQEDIFPVANNVMGMFGLFVPEMNTAQAAPSQPTTLKITCADSARQRTMNLLINLHAYRIVSIP